MVTNLIKRWINDGYKNFRAEMLLRSLEEESVSFNNYSMTLNVIDPSTGMAPILGTACALSGESTPDIWFKPLQILINVPCPNFVLINLLQVGTGHWIQGLEDAFDFSPLNKKEDRKFVLPLMRPGMPCKFLGAMKSYVPAGFIPGSNYSVCVTLKGIGTMQPDRVFRREAIKRCLIPTDDDIRPEWLE